MKYLLSIAAVVAATSACGSSDSATPDATPGACSGGTGCNGPCELGNELGVGMFCTKGGLECADTPNRSAPFCTLDSSDTEFAFCTRPCSKNEDCGAGAICESEGGGGPSGCFPVFCADGMGDGGVADANVPTDASPPDAD